MSAAAQPRLVKGSTTAVTTWRARKTSVIRARLRCSPVVRKRGQLALCTRSVERMPRTTTQLSRMSVTAPAPLVVYQRTLLDTGQGQPVTARGGLDEERTRIDGCTDLEEPVPVGDQVAE